MADVRHTLLEATRALERAGVPAPRLDAEWLLAHVLGMDRLAMRMSGTAQLPPSRSSAWRRSCFRVPGARRCNTCWARRAFTGWRSRPTRALIPRQETETLCETGIAHLRALGPLPPPAALDLCTGSGAIALALRHECPFAQVSASDASAEALSLARENARRLGLSVDFFAGDLFDAVGERRFDLILSNPPYIPSDECARLQPEVLREPRMALDGGADGLDFYRRIARGAPARLTARGMLAVEAGDGQAPAVAALFEAAGLCGVEAVSDLYGHARVVRAYAAGHL